MDLSRRSYQKELLDRNDIPFEDIKRNMHELNFINTHLGGHSITIDGIKKLLDSAPRLGNKAMVICEIGCGGGDNLKAIAGWCTKNSIDPTFVGIDINSDCIAIAREACKKLNATFIHSDYKAVNFQTRPSIIFSSLFCHHFANEELVDMLQWMHQNSMTGFFINDLHRHPIAYYSIKSLSSIFSRSYLVKNDAPLSVARGFTKKEWLTLTKAAGIQNFSIEWKWAFRWLVVSRNERESSSLHLQSQ